VITGNIGRKAAAVLKKAHIRLYLGAKGTVWSVIELFKEGRITKA